MGGIGIRRVLYLALKSCSVPSDNAITKIIDFTFFFEFHFKYTSIHGYGKDEHFMVDVNQRGSISMWEYQDQDVRMSEESSILFCEGQGLF